MTTMGGMTRPLLLLIIAPGIISLLLSPSVTAFSLDRRRQQCHLQYHTSSASLHPRHRHSALHDHRQIIPNNKYIYQYKDQSSSATSLSLIIGAGAASLIAGSLGGAIGVGVAYPFDTLKTKSQVYGQQRQQQQQQQQYQQSFPPEQKQQQQQQSQLGIVCATNNHHDDGDALCYPIESPEEDLISLIKLILEIEGVAGFFGGVKAMMIGQALIKSVAFSANEAALGLLNDFGNAAHAATAITTTVAMESSTSVSGVEDGTMATSFVTLILAASFSGFVTSFLVAPVERVKVMMQAQQNSLYANEIECIKAVLDNEGWTGLFSRGLGPTLLREVPSYAIYFVVYRVLMQTAIAGSLGSVAPLVCGAMSGCACWIPVYPIDVVKTLVQNTEGGSTNSAFDVAVQLYNEEGIGAFFNGLTPKMLRASVNHAVTFWVYDLVMSALQ